MQIEKTTSPTKQNKTLNFSRKKTITQNPGSQSLDNTQLRRKTGQTNMQKSITNQINDKIKHYSNSLEEESNLNTSYITDSVLGSNKPLSRKQTNVPFKGDDKIEPERDTNVGNFKRKKTGKSWVQNEIIEERHDEY